MSSPIISSPVCMNFPLPTSRSHCFSASPSSMCNLALSSAATAKCNCIQWRWCGWWCRCVCGLTCHSQWAWPARIIMLHSYGAVGVNSLFMDVAQCVNPAPVTPMECGLAYWVLCGIAIRPSVRFWKLDFGSRRAVEHWIRQTDGDCLIGWARIAIGDRSLRNWRT